MIFVLIAIPCVSADWSSVAIVNQITGKVIYPGDTVEFPITVESGYNDSEDVWCSMVVKKVDGVQVIETRDSILHIHANTMLRTEIAKSVKNAGGTISMLEEEE